MPDKYFTGESKRSRATIVLEILAVASIITIVAVVISPVLSEYREKARQNVCMFNEKELGTAIMEYAQDADAVYPMGCDRTWTTTWATLIYPYAKTYSVYRCPDDSMTTLGPKIIGIGISYSANGYTAWNGHAMGMMGIMGPVYPDDVTGGWIEADTVVRSIGEIRYPAQTIMLGEKHNDIVRSLGGKGVSTLGSDSDLIDGIASDIYTNPNAPQQIPDSTKKVSAPYPAGPDGAVTATHDGKANFLLCDGRVAFMNPADTNTPKLNMWDATRR